jgi:hypothetical protein
MHMNLFSFLFYFLFLVGSFTTDDKHICIEFQGLGSLTQFFLLFFVHHILSINYNWIF